MTNDPTPPSPTPEQPPPTTIKTVDNGPLQVKGPIRIVDHDGTSYDLGRRRTAFLCRCGRSDTKPFCDGAHAKANFVATERAPAPEPDEKV
ncbi:CDGSH iron-sulfur domain-containing protein [Nocardia speluncae]|uniref:CDGSH iron-sulfur domain-containing protein n=1 Tax=Nocardia speluncae TaxID=419477 RepID=A0A846XM90_9NOCA|nr:CDGSH iron-sulfur domain-containing protein [Nocardia speluncae]NKY35720.1 CDGSH iron-sulfur domain-containing protein [Nocardia speluncae]